MCHAEHRYEASRPKGHAKVVAVDHIPLPELDHGATGADASPRLLEKRIGAQVTAYLNARNTHAAGGRVDEHAVARLRVGEVLQAVQRAEAVSPKDTQSGMGWTCSAATTRTDVVKYMHYLLLSRSTSRVIVEQDLAETLRHIFPCPRPSFLKGSVRPWSPASAL